MEVLHKRGRSFSEGGGLVPVDKDEGVRIDAASNEGLVLAAEGVRGDDKRIGSDHDLGAHLSRVDPSAKAQVRRVRLASLATNPLEADEDADGKSVWAPHWTNTPVLESDEAEDEMYPTPEAIEPASDSDSGLTISEETVRPTSTGERLAPQVEVDPSDVRFETVDDPRIPPDQQVFRIGEASRIVGVKPHVLRFWETEFDSVEPEKTRTNQRRYRREDIVRLLQIRRLRHDAKLTVAQTRSIMEADSPSSPSVVSEGAVSATKPKAIDREQLIRHLADMRRDIVELLEVVEEDAYR